MGRPAQAGRPFVRYNEFDGRDAPSSCGVADRALSLPRLGGMARPNGVVIVSERYWAFAGVDGSLREGRMPSPPESLHRLPLARGLVRLVASLSPVFRREGVAPRRERYLILAARARADRPRARRRRPVVDRSRGSSSRSSSSSRSCAAARCTCTAPSTARSPPSKSTGSSRRGTARRSRRASRRAAARTSRRSRCRSPSSPTARCRLRRRSGRRSSCSCSRSR